MATSNGQQSGASGVSGTSSQSKKKGKNRKDPKAWQNILKDLSTLDDKEKITAIEEKYNALYDDYKKANCDYQALQTQFLNNKKENDHNQSELTKITVACARLEGLCRDLQKQNKQIKDENMAKLKEEEERRKEASAKFAEKLSAINNMVDENKQRNDQLRDENKKMSDRLTELYNKFQQKEGDYAATSRHMEKERQHSDAVIAKMKLELENVKLTYSQEIDELETRLENHGGEKANLLTHIESLENQLDMYKDVESNVLKTNTTFDNLKADMTRMRDQMKHYEKDAETFRVKYEKSSGTIAKLKERLHTQAATVEIYERKVDSLMKLCRQLQIDRGAYLKLLKDNNIEPTTPVSCLEVERTENIKQISKKEQELEILKSSLKLVQEELVRVQIGDNANNSSENATPSQEAHCSYQQPQCSTQPDPQFEEPTASTSTEKIEEKMEESEPIECCSSEVVENK